MSLISPLPSSTTRLLGSPLVITTPATLVKELLDNAIDAKATTVEVLISPDTISKIEVRDNGIGIHSNDYDSLGRHGHTSKLRSFEELRTHGSKTLGFRGEALAAANTMAKITVITRTAEDPVGATLHLGSGIGGVDQQQKASVPVGTTVRVTELFGRLPVREQVAIKESTKTLDKILELLQTYGMARPNIKLTFRVLQNPKKNWSYSPKRDAGIKEAVLQIAGKEIATRCLERIIRVDEPRTELTISSDHQNSSNTDSYTFEAYIMDPEADHCKLSKQHYFSVDGRPVSAKKGTVKKLLQTYTTRLESCLSSERSGGYFIRLNIICPRGSYDANVEPSKDEVLFTDEMFLHDSFEALCKEVYKSAEVNQPNCSMNESLGLKRYETVTMEGRTANFPNSNTITRSQDALGFLSPTVADEGSHLESIRGRDQDACTMSISKDLYSLQKRPQREVANTTSFKPIDRQAIDSWQSQASPERTTTEHNTTNSNPLHWRVDMSTDLNERMDKNQRGKRAKPTHKILDSREEPNNVEIGPMQDLNPWIIAKMNQTTNHQICDTANSGDQITFLPSEACGSPFTPEMPILQHPRGPPGDLDVPHSLHLHRTMDTSHDGGVVPGGPYRSPMSSPMQLASQESSGKGMAHPSMSVRRSLRRRSHQLPWTPPSSVQRPSSQREEQCDLEPSGISDSLKQTRISFNGENVGSRNHSLRRHGVQHQAVPFSSPTSQNNDDSVNVETVFSSARQQLDRQLSQQRIPTKSHRRSERRKSSSQLRPTNVHSDSPSSTVDKEPVKTVFPTGDPRAYLLRRQKSISAEEGSGTRPKLRRVKSSLMPLENSPEDDQTLLLILILHYDTQHLLKLVDQVQLYDNYMTEGELGGGIDMNLDEGHRIEERLKTLLSEQANEDGDEGIDMDINIGSVLKGKALAVDI